MRKQEPIGRRMRQQESVVRASRGAPQPKSPALREPSGRAAATCHLVPPRPAHDLRGSMAPYSDITEPAIRALVDRFYAKARRDAVIGPVFNEAVADWDEQLDNLYAFWS